MQELQGDFIRVGLEVTSIGILKGNIDAILPEMAYWALYYLLIFLLSPILSQAIIADGIQRQEEGLG